MTLIGIFVIISTWYGIGGSDEAQVVLGGEDNKSVIQQSSGFHVLELNNSGDSDGCQGWSWSEYALVIVGFVLFLKLTHILHYCLVSKAMIKSKVAKKVALQMKDLPVIPPPEDVVVVPGI